MLERLWAVAHCFHTEGSDEAEAVRGAAAAGPAAGAGRVRDRRAAAAAEGRRSSSGQRRKVVPLGGGVPGEQPGAHAVRRVPGGGLPDRQRGGGGGVPPSGQGPDGADGDAVDGGGGPGDAPRAGVCTSTTSGRSSSSTGWSRSKPGCTRDLRHSGQRVTPQFDRGRPDPSSTAGLCNRRRSRRSADRRCGRRQVLFGRRRWMRIDSSDANANALGQGSGQEPGVSVDAGRGDLPTVGADGVARTPPVWPRRVKTSSPVETSQA